eukprot:SAG31_NODE_9890_length_1215_cov_1.250000_2_plen_166_part_01
MPPWGTEADMSAAHALPRVSVRQSGSAHQQRRLPSSSPWGTDADVGAPAPRPGALQPRSGNLQPPGFSAGSQAVANAAQMHSKPAPYGTQADEPRRTVGAGRAFCQQPNPAQLDVQRNSGGGVNGRSRRDEVYELKKAQRVQRLTGGSGGPIQHVVSSKPRAPAPV